ncbi:hypothetical protein OSTOST_09676 [Ostertagia ostertagi]
MIIGTIDKKPPGEDIRVFKRPSSKATASAFAYVSIYAHQESATDIESLAFHLRKFDVLSLL